MHRPHQARPRRVKIIALFIVTLFLTLIGCAPPDQGALVPYFDAQIHDAAPPRPLIDAGPPPETLIVASYNLEQMFLPEVETWSIQHYRERIDKFGVILAQINADIIGLLEIDDRRVLVDLAEATRAAGGPDYRAVALAPGKETSGGLDVGLLSRFPILLNRSRAITWPYDCVNQFGPLHLDEDNPFARPILQANLDLNEDGAVDLVVFVNHWKSKAPPSEYRCVNTEDDRRRAALQLRDLFDAWATQTPSVPLIALGDFNCGELEAPLRDDLGAALVPASITDHADVFNAWGLRVDVQAQRNGVDNSSYNYLGRWSRLDHIILSGHFRPGGEAGYVPTAIAPFTADGALLREGVPYRQPSGYSDHLPVRLTLRRAD
ncbi:endonuclease/exonuclease/phosphatase family protein [Myxococcota bacterium]|nr:endonuclease/exonuclease/phosphatase family protein [Myxococcota bacterium]MBU1429919.1 endonuclease/exonuclease/phosphatase family protein [Myxococcota bacterium]MBU1898491.1 endonuclease/exonuclease/phosphatase family protein [Myxococcota bacterium]